VSRGITERAEPLVVVPDAQGPSEPPRPQPVSWTSRLPWALVGIAVAFNLWTLRAQLLNVQQLNDSSIHEAMVRWATMRIREGHLPFDGWFPYLSLGASRFHHYQSLPHIITAYLSIVFGSATFRWVLYLLLCFWPVAVYWGGRMLERGRWESAAAAIIAPLLVSFPGLGYEYGSYVWRGSGTWTQLWGMWALPLTIGLTWRAVTRRRSLALAALALGLTIAFHLLTGYLAVLCVGLWLLLKPSLFRQRILRALIVIAGGLAVSSFMLVPLLTDKAWAVQDEFSRGHVFYDSFGARKVLAWLFTGGLFDAGRLPVITIFVGVGLFVAIMRWRSDEGARAIVAFGLLSLALFFGRPTLGPILKILPGSSDLFLRRYLFGVHLAGIYLAGLGGVWVVRLGIHAARRYLPRIKPAVAAVAVAGLVLLLLTPAWIERSSYERTDSRWMSEQVVYDQTRGTAFSSLVQRARSMGGGRIFAGKRHPGHDTVLIGQVPGYAALLNNDGDGVGFTRPTWSLMSPAEYRFEPANPAYYSLFGIRYVITTGSTKPFDGATLVTSDGPFTLWQLPGNGYVQVVDTIAPIAADRTDLGQMAGSILGSDLIGTRTQIPTLPTVTYAGSKAGTPSLGPNDAPATPAGIVGSVSADPADGKFSAQVSADRASVVLLKASFDPRWTATVDGVAAPVEMVAPGLVGVPVQAGSHEVRFTYGAYPRYWLWALVAALALLSLALVDRRSGSRKGQETHAAEGSDKTRRTGKHTQKT
jgi:hypothetical protein